MLNYELWFTKLFQSVILFVNLTDSLHIEFLMLWYVDYWMLWWYVELDVMFYIY